MTARQPDHVEIDSEAFHFGDQLARKIDGKSQIITRGDETHRTRFHLEQPRNERNGTDWFPELAQLIDRQVGFDSRAHVLSRYSFPNHIGHITGHMIENANVDRGGMCESEKPNA